ncbi:hypothetical protein OUZ56_010948 [Daphnia magna]|uniref:Peptidase M14 domain-containing protein n=1 Tax=Daphnia magna TaxID=35525 RepID=A0ABQ9YYU7_9CRUS|nr:hypothetical protein OUZ56_010948 [Daphnia magna]
MFYNDSSGFVYTLQAWHVVIRAIPETKDQLELLDDWFSQTTSFLDFWFPPSKINKFVDIRVHPEWYVSSSIRYNHVVETLTRMNINHKIHIADVGELVRQEQETIALRRALYSGKAIDLENYHTYEEVGGTTAEGRDIVQLIISTHLSANKRVEFFECNVHAREWITAATCIWIIDRITTGYGSDPEIGALLSTKEPAAMSTV